MNKFPYIIIYTIIKIKQPLHIFFILLDYVKIIHILNRFILTNILIHLFLFLKLLYFSHSLKAIEILLGFLFSPCPQKLTPPFLIPKPLFKKHIPHSIHYFLPSLISIIIFVRIAILQLLFCFPSDAWKTDQLHLPFGLFLLSDVLFKVFGAGLSQYILWGQVHSLKFSFPRFSWHFSKNPLEFSLNNLNKE